MKKPIPRSLDPKYPPDEELWDGEDEEGEDYITYNRGKQARFAPALPAASGLSGPRLCWR